MGGNSKMTMNDNEIKFLIKDVRKDLRGLPKTYKIMTEEDKELIADSLRLILELYWQYKTIE